MIDTREARDRLMAVAREYAAPQKDRPEIIGIAVYGSLSNGDCLDLTPFSDIDLALVFEGPLPAYFAEHRLFQGVKVDLLHYRRKDLEAPVVIGRGSLPAGRAWFRLQRRGSEFAAWCSTDAENWYDCGVLSLPLEGPISIGLYGLSFTGRDPAKVIFDKIGIR